MHSYRGTATEAKLQRHSYTNTSVACRKLNRPHSRQCSVWFAAVHARWCLDARLGHKGPARCSSCCVSRCLSRHETNSVHSHPLRQRHGLCQVAGHGLCQVMHLLRVLCCFCCNACRYGCKQEATTLLQEWVQTVGRSAGLTPQSVRLSSGSIGVPESRLEVRL